MDKILTLLGQRRIWAGAIGALGFILASFGSGIENSDTLIDLLTNLGVALAPFAAAVLALYSYFKPRKK